MASARNQQPTGWTRFELPRSGCYALADFTGGTNERAKSRMCRLVRVARDAEHQGNQIRYEVTVEDPEVLVEPWVMTPRTLRLNPNPDAGLLPERGNCEVYELEDITAQIRH